MPRAVRDPVSHALEDGADWRAVAKLCEAAGYPGVRPQNVTNYRKGAHQEWLAKELRLDAIRRDSELTLSVMEHYVQNGGSPAEAGLLASAEIMSGAIAQMGPEVMAQLVADDPKVLLGMMRELARVAELLDKKKAAKLAAPATPADGKPTLTPEQRMAAMKEIFGLPV
jgi:hypothetical protein